MPLAAVQLPPGSISLGCPATVLLVEPERAVRILLARILNESGYEVVSAGDAGEALELLRRNGTGVDLVLTEVVPFGPRDLRRRVGEVVGPQIRRHRSRYAA